MAMNRIQFQLWWNARPATCCAAMCKSTTPISAARSPAAPPGAARRTRCPSSARSPWMRTAIHCARSSPSCQGSPARRLPPGPAPISVLRAPSSPMVWPAFAASPMSVVLISRLSSAHPKPNALPMFHWVNTVLGNLNISLSGAYHSFGFSRYAERYLGAIAYRFNRRFDLHALPGSPAGCCGTLRAVSAEPDSIG